jgi:hypothetical protein
MRQVVARHCVTFPTKRLKNILNSEFYILLKFGPLGLARIFMRYPVHGGIAFFLPFFKNHRLQMSLCAR